MLTNKSISALALLLAGGILQSGAAPSRPFAKRGLLGIPPGSAWTTPHQHEADAAKSLPGMPQAVNYMVGPKCGTPYPSIVNSGGTMDVTHVTSWSGLQLGFCGACLKVTGPAGTTNVLLIDEKGEGGFDMSATAFNDISGQHVPPDGTGGNGFTATFIEVDPSACSAHWNGMCVGDVDPASFPMDGAGHRGGGTSHGNYCS